MPSPHERLPPKGLLLLAALSLFWGLNWPIMKVVLGEVAPLTFRAICLLCGGSGLLLVARASGISCKVTPGEWPRLTALSLFNIFGWNVFAVYGVLLLSSGRAALLGYTMPLWGVILSVYMLGERFTARRGAGLVLGIAGIFTLMSDSFAGIVQAPIGAACMVAAALSWAFGIVLIKRLSAKSA